MEQTRPFFETGVLATADGWCAYPCLARLADGRLLVVWPAWSEKQPAGWIAGARSADGGRTWETPRTLIDTPGWWDLDPSIVVDGGRILVHSTTTPIPQPLIDRSRIFQVVSEDGGEHWTAPVEISTPHAYVVGKRHLGVRRRDGTLLVPVSWDRWADAGTPARTEGEMDLASGVMVSGDRGATWSFAGNLHLFEPKVAPGGCWGVVEPALVELANGDLYMLMRTATAWLYEARSPDGGNTWSPPQRSPLMSYNAPAALWRLDQHPEEILCVWNRSPRTRCPLSAALSADQGRTWSRPKDLVADRDPATYPSVVQAEDGVFVAIWTQVGESGRFEVWWARFNRTWLLA